MHRKRRISREHRLRLIQDGGERYVAVGPSGERVILHALRPLSEAELAESAGLGAILNARRAFRHAHVDRVVKAGVGEGLLYLMFESIPGAKTIRDRMRQGPRFTSAQALVWSQQITEACVAAHAVGLLHGDISAEDVVIAGESSAILLGLGVRQLVTYDIGTEDLSDVPRRSFTAEDDLRAIEELTVQMLRKAIPPEGRA
jgi:serine/threonine protein kinase